VRLFYLLALTLVISITCNGQIKDSSKLASINEKLLIVSKQDTAYLEKIDITSSKLPLSEIIKNIATISKVNISIQSAESKIVACNFKRIRVIDLVYFLCKEYGYDIETVGNIVSIFPYVQLQKNPPRPNIQYNKSDSTLSVDIVGVKLIDVAKLISFESGYNIIVPQSLYTTVISGFINRLPLHDAINTLMSINNLELQQSTKGSSVVQSNEKSEKIIVSYRPSRTFPQNMVSVDSLGIINISIGNGNVQDIIIDIFEKMKLNYHFINPVTRQMAIYVKNVDKETLLKILFTGTSYTWTFKDGIYFFGTFEKEKALLSSKVIQMKYRSISKIVELIPESLKANVAISPFPDLNSLVVSGDQKGIEEVEKFVFNLDKSVPLINIDVIIVESTNSYNQDVGLKMGIGDPPAKTTGTLSPGIDISTNAASIDKFINGIHGLGPINLGKMLPGFYLNLKLLEQSGKIQLRSTPKLATLNGYEANLKSGETKYYKEVQSNIYGAQNPVESKSYTWKSVEANLSLKITPFISKDSCITLNIELEQSEFTPRTDMEAPPGLTTRSFKSIIKVQSEDVVLLGGIERNIDEKSADGLPFISRVPVLKWIFGTTKKNKSDYKLNILIKSSVTY